MKFETKLTQRDKKLLLILAALGLLAVSYFLIYIKNMNAAEAIRTSNETLNAKVQELTQMQAQAEDKKTETLKMKQEIEDIKAEFPVDLSTADIILILDGLEHEADMKISSAGFTEHQIFYPNGGSADGNASSQTTDTTEDGNAAAPQGSNTTGADDSSLSAAIQSNKYIGMKSAVNISFKTTYAGLKKAIDYINKNHDRMTIGELNATYDTDTGNLSGSMVINMYILSGLGIQKTYEPPNLEDIVTGKDNIFGTLK